MKVVIANPPWMLNTKSGKKYGVRATSRWPHLRNDKVLPFPIYHAYAAAVLEKEGIEVVAIDAVDQELKINEFVKKISKINPDFIFLETSYPSYKFDKKTIEELSKKTKAKIGAFGPDATARAQEIMEENKTLDYIAYGEFDYTLLDIVKAKKIENVNGILYRKGKKIVRNPPKELIENLDDLPFPARHLYPITSYQEPINHKPQFLILTSRGCPFGCSFCVYPQTISGRRFRKRSVNNVIQEIKYLKEKYGAKVINIEDDTFTVDTERVKKLCDEIINKKIEIFWQCYSSVNITDKEMYRKMKEAGCEMIRFGVESASFVAQKHANKNLSKEKIKNGFKIARDIGLKTFGTFTFGLPGETKESIEDTIKLAIELNPYAVQFSYIVAYPGTVLFAEASKKGWIIKENQDGLGGSYKPSMVPDSLKRKDLEGVIQRAYKRFFLRPSYMLKMLLRCRNPGDFGRLLRGAKSLAARLLK